MAKDSKDCVKREEFIALCEQVALIAAELEERDRMIDPEGPNGWRLRKTTVIKKKVHQILAKQKRATERSSSGKAAA